MLRIVRLMKLHRLMAPVGEHGSDDGGTDTATLDEDEGTADAGDDTEGDGEGGEDNSATDAEDEVTVTIGDDAQATEEHEEVARAPEWVRDLRKQNREKDRRIRELEQKMASANPAPAAVVLGEKPTLASCDFDEAKFEADLEAWHTRKREIDEQAKAKEAAENKARESWQTTLANYRKQAKELKVKDFDDAEEAAKDVLSVVQQGIILNGAENASTMIYALGKNPKKAKELASITDPVKFAFAVAKLETQLKVTPRKTAPPPERTVRGAATGSSLDSTLEKLRAEADKTGDRSKVSAYIRNKNAALRG